MGPGSLNCPSGDNSNPMKAQNKIVNNTQIQTRSKSGTFKRKYEYNPYSTAPKRVPVTKQTQTLPKPVRTTASLENGDSVDVVLIPTKNKFDVLTDKDSEIKITPDPQVKKIRIPPITIFNQAPNEVVKSLAEANIKDYSIKHLRHGLHVYCNKSDDFKKARELFTSKSVHFYSHELPEDKQYKVVLKGLHRMDPQELLDELKRMRLNAVAARIINPRNAGKCNDVLFVVSFEKGTIKLNDLKEHRVVLFTRVSWEPYRHRGGLVQCSRCQRPGHGVKMCHMPPRCSYCAGDHESKNCSATHKTVLSSLSSNSGATEVQTPSRCCNCDQTGHFASDPLCPKRLQYIESRQRRNKPITKNRGSNRVVFVDPPQQFQQQPGPGKPSYAEILSGPRFDQRFSDNVPPGFQSHSDSPNFPSPSGNYNSNPFTVEETSSLICEILDSLHNLKHMPRHEAIKVIMTMAVKFLYNNGK